jgi:dTDP-4-dehydrorhamnose reductase
MTWLVVGGNGQLGKALSVVLGERGIYYRPWGSGDLDIRSATKCVELIGALKPSVIINAAGWTGVDGAESDPDGAYLVNATGALNLALAVKAVGGVFVQVSTDYVFSGVSDQPWREDDLRSPVSVYGGTKAAGEVAVLSEYPERSYIFRTAWLYSEWGRNFAKTMTRLALLGEGEVRVVDDQVGQPTSAIDLAKQIVDAVIAQLPFGIYHATNSGQGSWFDFAREVFELSGASDSRVVPVSSNEFVRPAKRPAYSVLGHDGWKEIEPMRDWRVALSEAMPAIVEAVREDLARG